MSSCRAALLQYYKNNSPKCYAILYWTMKEHDIILRKKRKKKKNLRKNEGEKDALLLKQAASTD